MHPAGWGGEGKSTHVEEWHSEGKGEKTSHPLHKGELAFASGSNWSLLFPPGFVTIFHALSPPLQGLRTPRACYRYNSWKKQTAGKAAGVSLRLGCI